MSNNSKKSLTRKESNMGPINDKDDTAIKWINDLLKRLDIFQDYIVYPGFSEPMLDEEGKKEGIKIISGDIRLYQAGITKLYEMVVEGKYTPTVKYSKKEEEEIEKKMLEMFPEFKQSSEREV